jgi:uncharacterized membrane protein
MAGIAFLLEKHLKRPHLARFLMMETEQASQAVGPWFLTISCLTVMGIMVYLATGEPPTLFYLLITYATGLSLIISAPIYTILSRFLADEVFFRRTDSIFNTLIAASVVMGFSSICISSAIIFSLSSVPLNCKITFIILTTLFSLLWCIVSVINSLDKDRLTFWLFLAGAGTSIGLLLFTGATNVTGLTNIFVAGIAVPVAGGYAYIMKLYLRQSVTMEWGFLRRPDAYKIGLALFAVNLGFWIDKPIFWYSDSAGRSIDPLFRCSPQYDYPFFMAISLMMIAAFIVYRGIKKEIRNPFRSFIFKLFNNFPFRELSMEKVNLVRSVRLIMLRILLVHGGVVMVVLFFVSTAVLPLPWTNPFVFHYLMVGTIFYALWFFCLLMMQYLDDYDSIFWLAVVFLILNIVCTVASIELGWQFYGLGFMVACIVSSVLSLIVLNSKLGRLEHGVFEKAVRGS